MGNMISTAKHEVWIEIVFDLYPAKDWTWSLHAKEVWIEMTLPAAIDITVLSLPAREVCIKISQTMCSSMPQYNHFS